MLFMSNLEDTSLRGTKQSRYLEEDCFVPRNDEKKSLLIVFVKTPVIGKVKTRLAKTVGDNKAFDVYKQLVDITEEASLKVQADKHIYFSDVVINSKWVDELKFVQEGENLGERMLNAFDYGFKQGYEKIILIGSDLPDISPEIIENGFEKLDKNEVVFGPAEDGGYYLVGMTKSRNLFLKISLGVNLAY